MTTKLQSQTAELPAGGQGEGCAEVPATVPESQCLTQDVDALHISDPGWDRQMRVRGALRRLREDGSAEGLRKVESIFGAETARLAQQTLLAERTNAQATALAAAHIPLQRG
jgi:hypothetical protein